MTGLNQELHWDEPDAGCVACGQPHLTVADHRCGDCIDKIMTFCPHCLGVIGPVVDREVVRRLRQTSADVNDGWRERKAFDWFRIRERVAAARKAGGAA